VIEMWPWILLFAVTGCIVFWYSKKQPFPEISGRFAIILLFVSIILWLATNAPRGEGNVLVPAFLASIIGGSAVIYGVIKMSITNDDVVVAPFGGILFCMGSITLLSERWSDASQIEQIGSFILASILVILELYLVFRGLIIGVQGISWSKSGLRQISRGLIHGKTGAIAHFEKSWDMDEQWINAMSHAALALIYEKEKNEGAKMEHIIQLEKIGGWEAVDDAWIETIRNHLNLN
tara:strand:+ start:3559 stop:4263 length:705 start_codon:yes stop_codon:yes gene_type:complete